MCSAQRTYTLHVEKSHIQTAIFGRFTHQVPHIVVCIRVLPTMGNGLPVALFCCLGRKYFIQHYTFTYVEYPL